MSSKLPFSPVPRKSSRYDGWTNAKQTAFIKALGDYGIVRAAAEKVGMSAASAYRLRESVGAASFCAAWDAALKIGMASLQDIAMDRAINGVAVPQYYQGELVGENRWYDNRLLMFMLRQTSTRRFGPLAGEYDFAEDVLAAEKRVDDRNAALLKRVEMLIEAYSEMIDSDKTELTENERMPQTQMDEMHDRLDALEDMRSQLTPMDVAKTLDNYAQITKAHLLKKIMRRRARGQSRQPH